MCRCGEEVGRAINVPELMSGIKRSITLFLRVNDLPRAVGRSNFESSGGLAGRAKTNRETVGSRSGSVIRGGRAAVNS